MNVEYRTPKFLHYSLFNIRCSILFPPARAAAAGRRTTYSAIIAFLKIIIVYTFLFLHRVAKGSFTKTIAKGYAKRAERKLGVPGLRKAGA